ncbi:MAG TPA: aminotransferase class V-fold PLP-dependent enzyme [Candidatus Acidoferrum sp.]|nr:aminotransferase class V-fold PLP-dependent enzyme [Candidatus Acidoferrum sp.]
MSEIKELLGRAGELGARYAEEARTRRVAPSEEAVTGLAILREKFSDAGMDAAQVLELLHEIGSPATVAMTGGRYFGFVIGGVLPAAMAANWLAGAWGQNACLRVMSPIAAELEDIVLGWICDALRLPADCEGGFVTCATAANFCGLAAARTALLARDGWDVESDGLFGAPPIEVIVGDEYHASMQKALTMVGFGKNRVTRVPTDAQGRMCADKFPARLSARTIVCIQAGNVNTGAFDPAEEICRRAKEAGAWVHVDGAFGLWARVSPKYDELTRGLELADSWATDAHKWLNVGYDSGVVLVRDGLALKRSMGMSAAYLQAGALREPMHHVPDSSRRARGVELWAALKSLGRGGVRDLVERTCDFAKLFAQRLRAAGYEILNDVEINQALVSFGSAEKTREVIRRVQEDGTCWCGGTVWQGKTAMRISVSNWSTTRDDIEKSADAIIRIAENI